jgi:glycosyltransferase involved in cell wall biosynthesis
MGPDPEIGGGMAAAIRALIASPLRESYTLEVVPTYRSPEPLRRFGTFCSALVRLAAWSLRGRGRIVHVHGTVRGSMYRKAACVLLARSLRRRVVLQIHSGAGDIAAFAASRGRLSLALFGAAFSAADVVLAVSAASAEAVERAYGLTGIGVVPNAAPPIVGIERRAAEPVEVVYLGGFANPAKGGDLMLAALSRALEGSPKLRVSLAGPGDLPPQGQQLLGQHPSIKWRGWLESEEKNALLRAALVLAMPSRSEGLPMTLLEAMAYGVPVVATRVGGIPEVLEDEVSGLLVPADRPQAIADAILRLVGDSKLREALAHQARRRVERLDAEEVAGRLRSIYAGLA